MATMERRGDRRALRRFRVSFWPRGSGDRHVGYTVNISTTGMFVATTRPLPPGTRLRVQVGPDNRDFILEAEVARALRVQQQFQNVRPSGMGLRFLSVAELVAELAPETAAQPPAPEPHAARSLPPPEAGVYRVVFNERQQLMAALESDVKTGWLYVPTSEPADAGEVVEIDLTVRGYESDTLRLRALVVECPWGRPDLLHDPDCSLASNRAFASARVIDEPCRRRCSIIRQNSGELARLRSSAS